MKKLSDIVLNESNNTIVPPITAVASDRVANALQKLDQIGEMVDDIYNTVSHLDEIDTDIDAALTGAYNIFDDLYAKIDERYDIVAVDLDGLDEEAIEESYELDEAKFTDSIAKDILKKHGFNEIDKDRIKNYGLPKKIGNPKSVYGIPVPPSKVTDLFFIFMADGTYAIFDYDDLLTFRNPSDAINRIKKMMNESYELAEALSADDEAGEWISDFVKSDAPQFKGKSKKERIKMALAAYYAAQDKEDLDESFRPGHDMVPAPIGNDTYKADGLRKLWGIKMRAGKWADTFVALYDDGRFGIVTPQGVNKYSNVAAFEKGFAKFRKTGDLDESGINENVDSAKIKELVSLSLIDDKDVAPTIAALKASQLNKTLTPAQIKLLGNLAVMLTNVILGDVSALSSVKRASKE